MTAPNATAYDWFMGLLDALGSGPTGKRTRQCPAHPDAAPSLSISPGRDGRVLVRCHAGCGAPEIMRALNCPMARLFTPATVPPAKFARTFCDGVTFPPLQLTPGGGGGWTAVSITEHPYGDPTTWAWKVRERNSAGAKRVYWESLNPRSERVPGLLGRAEADMPLYRVRELRMAVSMGETVVLVESESSVDALGKAGIYATTWPGGAASPPLGRLAGELGNADVLLVPDYDAAGLVCADRIVRALPNARVQLGDPGQDARDVLATHGTTWFR